MPSYLFAELFLLLVVFCALCGGASADTVNVNVELFEKGPINVSEDEGVEKSLDIDRVFSPSLVGTNGVMVALAQVTGTDDNRYILAKHIETEGDKWSDKDIKEKSKNWKAQFALKNENGGLVAFAPFAKNDSVYILSSGKVSSRSSFQQSTNSNGWDFKLTVGKITDGIDGKGKIIRWSTKGVSEASVKGIESKLKRVFPVVGSAFSMEDGTFVFVLKTRSIKDKDAFLVAHSKDLSKGLTLKVAESTADCSYGFFPWDTKLFMVPKRCSDGRRYRVKVSNDMGENWNDASEPLAEELNKVTGETDAFTSIDLDEKHVLLFTERKSTPGDSSKNVFNLLIGYDNKIENMGPIVTNVRSVSRGSFVYTNDKLFFLSLQEVAKDDEKIILTRLDKIEEKMKKIKEGPKN